jgi:transglutaminase-like putative cysteine protease
VAAAAAQAVGLALLLLETVGRHTAFGLPTPASVSGLLRAAGRAPDALRAAIVPAPAGPELLLLVVAGLWVATALADGLARRSRAGLAAVVPLAVFPVVVAALGTDRGKALLTFAFAATTALYATLTRAATLPVAEARPLRHAPVRRSLLLSRGSALGGLRPPISRRSAAGPGAGEGAAGVAGGWRPGAIRLAAGPAVLCGVAAVLLGPLVPGMGEAVVDVHALGVTLDLSRVELNPLVDIQPQLLTPRRTELFTVRATAPAYWRLTALDRFDGRLWSPSRPAVLRRHAPAAGTVTGQRALSQDIRVTALDSPWLPAADRAIRVQAAGTRLDPETDSLVTRRGSRRVRTYRVESRLPVDRSDRPGPAAGPSAVRRPDLGRYLALPPRFPSDVKALAERFTAGAATPFDRAVALEDSLRVGFIYDETAPSGTSVDALEEFLFDSRRGYCEQFAGAYAAMARSLGLPARVAVGFTPGTWDEATGSWRVTTREAHAWPEVFLEGIGWTAFEPTPGRVLPDPETAMRPHTDLQRLATARSPSLGGDNSALARIDPGAVTGRDAGPGGRPAGLAQRVTHSSAGWVGLGMLGLALVPPGAKHRRRGVRRRAAGDAAVLGAWRETLDRLGEAGMRARGSETPLEYAGRAGATWPAAAPALRRLAGLVNGAAYGPGAGVPADEAWAATDRVLRALDDHDPPVRRLRRRLDPRPLLRRD